MHEKPSLDARRRGLLALPALLCLPALAVPRRLAARRAQPSPTLAFETLGTYQGPGCSGTGRLPGLARWLGRTPARHSDFLAQDAWEEMVKAAHRGARCWGPAGLAMSIGVPMLPRAGDATLAAGARGEYDSHFVQIAQAFVQNGLGRAVVRLGWEFNHDWFAWRADRDPAAWVVFWQRIVAAMDAVEGADFAFDWCPAWGDGKLKAETVYPGDAYVDIIGLDIYNTTWNPTTPEQRWRIKRDHAHGLAWHRAFAAQHDKPVSFPEWGTGKRPDGRGGGDDPHFMDQMAAWLADSDLAYHNYWDYRAPDFDGKLSDGSKPQSEAVFLHHFGEGRR